MVILTIDMTNNEIVDEIAKNKLVRKIIQRITKSGRTVSDADSLNDLEQDLYVSLLSDKNLVSVYEDGMNHLNYYLARIVMNNICSNTSGYYRRYLLPRKKFASLLEAIAKDETGDTD